MANAVRTWALVQLLAASVFSQSAAPVTDINPGSPGGDPSYLSVMADILYFRANNMRSSPNTELWRYDGITAEMAVELRQGSEGSLPSYMTPFGDYLYFAADNEGKAPRVWRYDGTTAELAPDPLGWKPQNPEAFFPFQGILYFRAFKSHIGSELFAFDGSQIVAYDLFPGSGSSYPQHFVEYSGNMYFNAGATPGEGAELYRWDPAGKRAVKVTSINPGGASPEWFCVFAGALYFSAYEPTHGRELWKYQGGLAARVADIIEGPESSNPSGMTVYRDAIYFGAEDGIHGTELWRFNGVEAELVANINQNAFIPDIDPVHHSWPSNFFVFEDVLYFSADDGIHGRELWMYDGVEVRMVADIYAGQYGSEVGNFVNFRGSLLFTANDGITGQEMTAIKVYQLIKYNPTPFRRGDANADGKTDISDAIWVLIRLLGGGEPPSCAKSADADDSGTLSIGDPIATLNYLFAGGPALSPPFRSCGLDETADDLACDLYPPCGE